MVEGEETKRIGKEKEAQVINPGLFTSQTDKWNTPKDLLEFLYQVFEFDLDPCSDRLTGDGPNVKAKAHYIEHGLELPWAGVCYANPPYGREIPKWVAKAAASTSDDAETVVCLLPARTDTRWWQDCIPLATLVTFIKGRLKFSDHENPAPFPSAIVVFGKVSQLQAVHLSKLGWTVYANHANVDGKD